MVPRNKADDDESLRSSSVGPTPEEDTITLVRNRGRRVINEDEDEDEKSLSSALEEDEEGEMEEEEEEEEEEEDDEDIDQLQDDENAQIESDFDELDEEQPVVTNHKVARRRPGRPRRSGAAKTYVDTEEESNEAEDDQVVTSRTGRRIKLRINQNKKESSRKSGGKRQRRGQNEDDDEDIVETLLDDDSQDEFENSNIFASLPKTARQLAKEKAGQGGETPPSELVELPADVSKKVKMTENEIALKRSETARRRRNQTEKKLEDDKIETINRLLKKQVSRTSGRKRDESESENEDDATDGGRNTLKSQHQPTRQELKDKPQPFFRYIQSTRNNGTALLSLPQEDTGSYKRKWEEMFSNDCKHPQTQIQS